MDKLRGHIYYYPNDDGSGKISIITFIPLDKNQVGDMEVVTFDAKWLSDFITEEPNIGSYKLLFDEEGKPDLIVQKPEIEKRSNEDILYHLERYCGDPGVVVEVYPETGTLRLNIWGGYTDKVQYARDALFCFVVTKPLEPNVILRRFYYKVEDILDSDTIIEGLPLGLPTDTYSLWALTPDVDLKVWWTKHDD